MSQSGYTPIQLYRSATSTNVPSASNLADGELAINTADGKLFYKDSGGSVQTLAGKGGAGVVAGSNTQLQFNNSGVFGASANLTWDGSKLTASAFQTGGNLTFTGTGNRITGDFSNATVANRVAFQSSTANSGSDVSVIPNGTSTDASFVAYNNSTPTNASRISIYAATSEVSIRSAINGTGTYLPMTFYTSGSEKLRIDTSGNVGIGTNAPSYQLETTLTAKIGTFLGVGGNPSANARLVLAQGADYTIGTNYALYIGGNGYTGGIALDAVSMQIGQNSSTRSLTFHSGTSFAERMRIDGSGNVGIGTNSPAAKLHVVGNNGTNGTSAFFTTDGTGGVSVSGYSNVAYIQGQASAAGSAVPLCLNQNGGNVGIGTSSPVAKLQTLSTGAYNGTVNSRTGVHLQSNVITGGFANTRIQFSYDTGTPKYYIEGGVYGADYLSFGQNTTEEMRLVGGNLGIGTNSPGAKLTVSGAGFNGGAGTFVSTNSGNSVTITGVNGAGINDSAYIYFNDQTNNAFIGLTGTAATAGAMRFAVGGTERMRIDSSGVVNTTGNINVCTGQTGSLQLNGGAGYTQVVAYGSATDVSLNLYGKGVGAVTFNTNGGVLQNSPTGLGYGTGAGGTVTQATNKSTSVTLNKPAGLITTSSAALAAGAEIVFNVNNSLLAVTDTVILNPSNNGTVTGNAYETKVGIVAAGLFSIKLKNTTAGSLSEAVPINFAIIKGATS